MVMGVDASHAFVSDPTNEVVDYLYLDPPRERYVSSYLETVISTTPEFAFVAAHFKDQMESDAALATELFALAESAPNDQARRC